MAEKGKMSTEKWVFRGKMGVFELEINRTSNQTRKVKWCKMQVLFLKQTEWGTWKVENGINLPTF